MPGDRALSSAADLLFEFMATPGDQSGRGISLVDFWAEGVWAAGADLCWGFSAGSAAAKGSKLRYPLRSAGRAKLEPAAAAVEAPPSVSAPRRYFFQPSSEFTVDYRVQSPYVFL